jgi:hypothetical protein
MLLIRKDPSRLVASYKKAVVGQSELFVCGALRAHSFLSENFFGEKHVTTAMENEKRTKPKPSQREGPIARTIEQQTAKLPSDTFLWAALGSIGVSMAFQLMGDEKKATFVGHWAPTILILGLYNKLVKLQGSDGV